MCRRRVGDKIRYVVRTHEGRGRTRLGGLRQLPLGGQFSRDQVGIGFSLSFCVSTLARGAAWRVLCGVSGLGPRISALARLHAACCLSCRTRNLWAGSDLRRLRCVAGQPGGRALPPPQSPNLPQPSPKNSRTQRSVSGRGRARAARIPQRVRMRPRAEARQLRTSCRQQKAAAPWRLRLRRRVRARPPQRRFRC
jgi:hypothetical protein